MNTMHYEIYKHEIDDFVKSCEKRGINPYEFKINNFELQNIIQQQLTGKLILKNSHAQKSYRPCDFPGKCAIDVEDGFFG